ncbi:RNA polymerase sigma factor [Actinokineospora iranica]|uniref:DNA-directed RNA polymerase specialized sigma subunit, sigma24 family n=1 Tax=Actinokineospora iranica TaxID=1271860 RepID=A0A1G6LET3_9PSEU|nr:sigma-70 family RNA polymerase sigma factor [Actinokineospora iranica]SDC41749.1 DNA-directed RNA polymerase specialized sigma subunit, sigma24 family [Actinokineospora iranica]
MADEDGVRFAGPDNLPSPRRVRRAHESDRAATEPGRAVVDLITGKYDRGFRRCVFTWARRSRLDFDELYQESIERLLKQATVDPGHPQLMAWVARCVRFAELELLRKAGRAPVATDAETLAALAPAQWDDDDDTERVIGLLDTVLPEAQRAVVEALVRGDSVNLVEIADLLGRSHEATRQNKSRAAKTLCEAIGLTDAERAAYRDRRRDRDPAETARRLGVDTAEVARLARQAHDKVCRFLQ